MERIRELRARDLLPALMVSGFGVGLAFVTMSIGALEGVEERDSGLASGLVNATQQIGGALGVAVLSAIAVSRSEEAVASHPKLAPAAALTEGFGDALLAGTAFAAVAALLAAVLIRRGFAPVAAAADPQVAAALETRRLGNRTPGGRRASSEPAPSAGKSRLPTRARPSPTTRAVPAARVPRRGRASRIPR